MPSTSAGSVAVDLTLNSRAFDNQVAGKIKQTGKAFQNGFNGINKSANTAFSNISKSANSSASATESAFSTSFGKIGAIIASAFAVSKVIEFGKTCVQTASDAQAAWTGLNSIVKGTGNDFATAQQFLTKYTQDGLVAVEDAATAYKNLLARGYDTSQIENVMTALKDSAAFGRQSSYTLSQAVVSATEGLKNENSILVDNAGVTKNVAKMWDEYAASIGTTANNLTQQQKIQAEVNGILTETKFQAGDAATYTSTFAGKVQQLKGAFSSMKTAIGKVVSPIVGLFIPAITAAVNAITGLFNRLASFLSMFGLEFPDVVESAASSAGVAARSIGDVGDSANETAGNLARTGTAAQKAAKKMNKAFASVDELNVMRFNNTESSSGSSGGSGGSGGGSSGSSGGSSGGSIGGISGGGAVDTGNTAVGSAIEKTSKKIQDALEPLNKISFDNLIKAFGRLVDAVKPLGKTIWSGLKWAYKNILVPLAKWTIEDLLPAFLDLLSGALKVLNPILQSFGRIFKPIWDNLLKPVLSWTGDTIVKVLEGIGKALGKIGDWMSKNGKIVDIMTGSVIAFFAAWKVTQLMAFIQMSGGVVAALAAITGGIVATIAAKLIDKAETIYLTALYAKDFVLACAASVKALLAQAAAFVAANATIILITAAIAAVIAIVVLLVKNWDKVKEVAINCWNKIKETWQKVADWFSKTVVEPVKKFFSDLWDKTKELAINAWNGIKKTWQAVKDWFKSTVIDPVKKFFSDLWSKTKELAINAWNGIKNTWKAVKDWFNNTVITPVKNFFSNMWTATKNAASNAWTGIKNVWNAVTGWFKNTIITPVTNTFKNLWNSLKNGASSAWSGIKNVFGSVGSFFGGIWNTIKSKFTNIGQKIGSAVSGAFKGAVNAVLATMERVLNTPIRAINSLIGVINKVPGVKLGTLSTFKLPRMAEGAYLKANNPTLAIVGDNKTEGEFVAPENKLKQSVKEAMQELGGISGNNNLKFDFTVRMVSDDGRTIIKKINDVTIKDGKVSLIV